jgi:hypothetical protein
MGALRKGQDHIRVLPSRLRNPAERIHRWKFTGTDGPWKLYVSPPQGSGSRKRSPQCHRCQLYGHTQTGCKAKFKCSKCAGEHSTHICTKVKTIDAKCANSGGFTPPTSQDANTTPREQRKQKQTSGLPFSKGNP